MIESPEELRARFNDETGKLSWKELERHFARGALVWVAADLDLIDVAVSFARDEKSSVARWLTEGRVTRASAEQAQRWHREQPVFWAVVAAPWVLVQEVEQPTGKLH